MTRGAQHHRLRSGVGRMTQSRLFKPVTEWTSNDVPSVESLDLYAKRPDLDISGKHFGAAVAFGAMVKHLNAHYPRNGTAVYRAFSPSRNKAGITYADRARAVSQAAVRNQFVDCDSDTNQLADWTVQQGAVQWDTP